jgi:hypothetical protein
MIPGPYLPRHNTSGFSSEIRGRRTLSLTYPRHNNLLLLLYHLTGTTSTSPFQIPEGDRGMAWPIIYARSR